ncbi:EF-hand domain-containing protein [Streptomyces iconiensis]|uniref:EF-hand domain-containing protein n=1 Tax=Streptomyces iconiensis TaxID=1384038 RepID=A0ABT7AAK9_9ACTN|nr:EF-hand domain-containing protein [Streptomyces iconiensis]MDJ1138380.1 EF-hand domain-containing protein [Streptomyces iconiensis]
MTTATTVLDTKLDRAFSMLDANGTGSLVEADLLALADKLGAAFNAMENGSAARLRQALADLWKSDLAGMDADGDGEIDVDEFRAGVRRAVAEDREGFLDRVGDMVEAWMSVADADGDGLIDVVEFTTMYTRTLGASPDALAASFARLDTDGDGTLDSDEIRRATEEFYTSEDPDAPGNQLFGPLNEA